MSDAAWRVEYSIASIATPAFAWTYMSDVSNWDDPPAQFRLEGAFASGARGSTEVPGQPARHWELRDVRANESYAIEFSLDRATLSFAWRFGGLPDGGTRLTQQIALQGENAPAYLADVRQALESNLAPGMSRIADAIDRAYRAR
jgi:hypothetical protein